MSKAFITVGPEGKSHTFSQFGSGTLANVPTYLGPNVVVWPEALLKEAQHLLEIGLSYPLKSVSIDSKCLITTAYHRALNRLREIKRGFVRHGSCGHGIAETRKYWLKYNQDSIFAKDLKFPHVLEEKLNLIRQRILLEIQEIQLSQTESVTEQLEVFDLPIKKMAKKLWQTNLKIVEQIPNYRTAVFEGAQGVLLDEWFGFFPYVTRSTVTSKHAHELITEGDEVTTIGCIRPYATKHGAGPLPNEDKELTKHVNDTGNPWNQWQENFRTGWLDLGLLKYALDIEKVDCLAVSCIDHLENYQETRLYDGAFDFSKPKYNIRLMESNTEILKSTRHKGHFIALDELLERIAIVPIGIEGRGPTWKDRKSNVYQNL